jgi:hypothetical protein
MQSSIRIYINASILVVHMGGGSLVRIDGKYYIATVRPVADRLSAQSGKVTFVNQGGIPCSPTGDAITSAQSEAALIPVTPHSRVVAFAVNVSRDPLRIGTMLWGIVQEKVQNVLQHGRVLEQTRNGRITSDCGGHQRFAGTGYVNSNDTLVAMHIGDDYTPHLSLKSKSWAETLDDMWASVVTDCSVTQLPLPEACFKGLRDSMELASRNRRARVIDAKALIDLIDVNRTEGKGGPEARLSSPTPSPEAEFSRDEENL